MNLEPFFSRRLLVVSGKGGVGKTTVAAALASLAARSGKRVLLISTDGRGDAAALFGKSDTGYRETPFDSDVKGLTADFDSLLTDFVRTNVPVSAIAERILASTTFRYFTRATPGLPDLLLLGKVRQIFLPIFAKKPVTRRSVPYDLVVLDAPATGHALSLVAIPRTLLKTIPAGPLRKVAHDLDRLIADPELAQLVIVAEPAELSAREAEELAEGARTKAGLETGLVVINRIGRSGAAEKLPRLDIPSLRVPELDTAGDADETARFFDVFRGVLQGRAAPPLTAKRAVADLPDTLDAAAFLSGGRLVVLTGPGGVGKTTLAAAAGIAAARAGRRVLVLTVDPARRLAQTLGLEESADRPVEVDVGAGARGSFRAMQIDPKATFERLLSRVASPDAIRRIHENRLYSGLVDSLPGILEYMGVEALAEHARDPEVDLIVLDTPPAARGIDFLSAPDRMVTLLENDALRWFLRSDSLLSRALSGATRGAAAILKVADKILGLGFLTDLADFFHAFDGLYDGFKDRSRQISALLREGRFLVVTSLDRSALATAVETADALRARGVTPALLVNRVPAVLSRARRLPEPLRGLATRAIPETADGPDLLVRLAARLVRG